MTADMAVPLISPLISIAFTLRESPYGGGNQFLGALKGALAAKGHCVDDANAADVILFNGHHDLDAVMRVRVDCPDGVFIHRVDGPMCLYNDPKDKRDWTTRSANALFADGTVFQSNWSKGANEDFGWPNSAYQTVITNAPDPVIFHSSGSREPLTGRKVRLIASSWSANANKGFDLYEYLDQALDFERFEMTFIGNAPVKFENITRFPPCPSADLAAKLKEADVFIAGSRFDPCSNALIEAMHSGLPAVARNEGGHPEIVGKGGELFDAIGDAPSIIDRVVRDYQGYVDRIDLPSIDHIAELYTTFAKKLVQAKSTGRLKPKTINFFQKAMFQLLNR